MARTNIHGGPQRQQWQGQQYNPQAGQQNYNNNNNKPAPYNKFSKKLNNFNSNSNQKPDYNKPSRSKGPNWAHNRQNHDNKKQAKQLLMDQMKTLETNQVQPKPDKKGKGKAVKTANLLARINEEIPLRDRMEGIDSYNERVFTAPESAETNKNVQMDVDDEIVSLGDDDIYEDARQF